MPGGWLSSKRICLPMQEPQKTWVRSLRWEDPLEGEMATHSNILAGTIPWIEEPGRLQCMGLKSQTWLSDWARAETGDLINLHQHQDIKHFQNPICFSLFVIYCYWLVLRVLVLHTDNHRINISVLNYFLST